VNIDYQPAGPVVEAFHQSNAFVRGLMGPVGSSKSSACFIELLDRSRLQEPDQQKIRPTRWIVLRNTYPELKSTTIKTVLEWAPYMQMKWDSPITGLIDRKLPDGTRWHSEFVFLALERPEEVDKLGSLEATGGWINEAREVQKGIFDKFTERLGRYPPKKRVKLTWRGGVMDTNPPDSDHWWYRLAERSDQNLIDQMYMIERKMRELGALGEGEPLFQFFRQPGGLIKTASGDYLPNPDAENIQNLDGGHAYYYRGMAGKAPQYIEAQILGNYAIQIDGKPIYPEYNDQLHCREIQPIRDRPLIIGLDYGLTPAAVICQLSPRGQLLVLDELCSEDMGISQFARDVLKPHLQTTWNGYGFSAVGDPTGNRRAESDEKTCYMELAEQGIPASPAISNDFIKRREAVAKYLTRLSDGKPTLLVHPRCTRVRKGFMGGYCFKRLQVGGEKYRDVADKNAYSHPHDALQYAALYTEFVDSMNFVKKIDYRERNV
jgi:hypothetical protein